MYVGNVYSVLSTFLSSVNKITGILLGWDECCGAGLPKISPSTLSKTHCAAQHRFLPDMMPPYLDMNHFVELLALSGLNWIESLLLKLV